MKKLIVCFCFFMFCYDLLHGQDYSNAKNLKDSILVHYSWDDFKKMPFEDKTDLIRKLRNQEPRVWSEKENTDKYGIPLIKDVPLDSTRIAIDSLVQNIDSLKNNYLVKVFPNSYSDVMNEYFGGMYDDIVDRTLQSKNYKDFEFEQGAQLSWMTNLTKRSYFFDNESEIKLIEIEVAYNVNEGPKMKESEMQPLFYKLRRYYFDNSNLKFVYEVNARQNVDKYYHNITQQDLDSTKVDAYSNRLYFYKDNCFLNLRRDTSNKGMLQTAQSPEDVKKILKSSNKLNPTNWERELENIDPSETRIDKSNKHTIVANNYIWEYKEYGNNTNDYLNSTKESNLRPYILNAEDN